MSDTGPQEIEPIRNPVLSYEEFIKRYELKDEDENVVELVPVWNNFISSFQRQERELQNSQLDDYARREGVSVEELDIRASGRTIAFKRFVKENPDLYLRLADAAEIARHNYYKVHNSIEDFLTEIRPLEQLYFDAYCIMKGYDSRLTDDQLFA